MLVMKFTLVALKNMFSFPSVFMTKNAYTSESPYPGQWLLAMLAMCTINEPGISSIITGRVMPQLEPSNVCMVVTGDRVG